MLRFLALSFLFVASHLIAGPVVLTGDSITVDYAPFVPNTVSVAEGGLDASAYMGQTAGTVNRAQIVVDLDPEIIVFMLGTNDAARTNVTDNRFNLYKSNVGDAFDLFAGSTASRIVVLSILPVDEAAMMAFFGNDTGDGMNARVNTNYNPWLQDQVAARPKFEYLDVNSAMQTNPNWVTELLDPDGFHPSNPVGRQWLADQVIAVIPEPSSFLAVALCGLMACAWQLVTRPRWVLAAAATWRERSKTR